MKKALTSAFVVTIAVVITFVLGTGAPAQAGGGHDRYDRYYKSPTILDTLVRTDGAQALVAAVVVVDGTCPEISELLDDRRAKLTLLAPNNTGFEEFLKLDPGTLDGLSIGNIVEKLVDLNLNADNVCGVLLNHVSVEGAQSKRKLLKRGLFRAANETEFPVAIGGPAGVWINYKNAITEADVVAANGVIHILDSVIAEAPFTPPTTPDLPDKDTVCQRNLCAADSELAEECQDFLDACIDADPANEEECVAGALLICSEI